MPIQVFDRPPRVEAYPLAIHCPHCKARVGLKGAIAMEGRAFRVEPTPFACPSCRTSFVLRVAHIQPQFR